MTAFYNEIEPYAAEWMENLAKAGHIAEGVVDKRSIRDLRAVDVGDHTQCHFFAGLGGWSYALRLAGWPDEEAVWTGSCPCQPFSVAGRGKGAADDRHLWPAWFNLIRECRPPIVFGEQVASPAGLAWFDAVSADLEGAGYAVGAADLAAASVAAPHIRQRLYFVADAERERNADARPRAVGEAPRGVQGANGERQRLWVDARERGDALRAVSVGDAGSEGLPIGPGPEIERGPVRDEGQAAPKAGASRGFWDGAELLHCRDGKHRPTQPGVHPLAYGVSARVGKLRAYGNAIVPHVAAIFVRAVIEARRAQPTKSPKS